MTLGEKDIGDAAFTRQMFLFYAERLVTLVMEELILFVFITVLSCPGLIVKTAAQVVVILANYIISKAVVFRKD
jgi:putative flippase GtrA